jgi:hypothetical protein
MTDFAIVATTSGTGPFRPKIMLNGVEYNSNWSFDTEHEAQRVADEAVAKVVAFAPLSLRLSGFEPDRD